MFDKDMCENLEFLELGRELIDDYSTFGLIFSMDWGRQLLLRLLIDWFDDKEEFYWLGSG